MILTVLGSGTSVPHPKRSSSAFWIETENGSIILDLSPSAIHRMAEENLDWANLDAIWISHFHLDHAGGLAPFLFGTKYAPQTQDRKKPLRIFGGKGLRKLIDSFDQANSYGLLEQPFPVEVTEVEHLENFAILPGIEAIAVSTPHTRESHAIRITDNGHKSMVFTADTGFTKEVATLARGADLFVLECSFVKNKPVEKHLELAEAIFLIRYSKVKRAMLTHFYPEWDAVDFAETIAAFEPLAEIIEAKDGLRIDL